MLFWVLGFYAPKPEPKKELKPEQRIKVSLREPVKKVKESPNTSRQQQPEIAPPMPKGNQLKKLVQEPLVVPADPKPVQKPKPVVQQPVKPKEPAKPVKPVEKTKPLPPKQKHIVVADRNITKSSKEPEKKKEVPKESSKLYAMLSKQSSNPRATTQTSRQSNVRESRISENVKEAYGDMFGTLSAGEQKYILDNQEIMRRITQETLNRVGRVNVPNNLRVNTSNIIQFYLHPNGDITDIELVNKSGFYILDDTTRETIEYAYSRYPKPEQKTLIRYKVGYYLRGY
jgi:outer membrane biosynthesis protein TonB